MTLLFALNSNVEAIPMSESAPCRFPFQPRRRIWTRCAAHGLQLLTLSLLLAVGSGESVLASTITGPKGACATPSDTETARFVERYIRMHGEQPGYRALILLPASQLKPVLHALPAQSQYDFWSAHLRSFESMNLDARQVATLKRAIDLLTPDLFARARKEGPSAVRPQLDAVRQTLASSFSRLEVAAMLGPNTPHAPARVQSALNRMQPQQQYEFWRSHLRLFLGNDLTPDQRAALNAAIDRLTPSLFERKEVQGLSSIRPEIDTIRQTLSTAFSPIEIAAILTPPDWLMCLELSFGQNTPA